MTAEAGGPAPLREQIAENQRTIDRLNRDLARKSNEVRIIQQISAEITSTLDHDQVLQIVLGALERVLGFRHSMILLKDLTADRLTLLVSRGYDPSGVGAIVAFGDGVVGVVAARRRMLRIGSVGMGVAYVRCIRARLEAVGEAVPLAGAAVPGLPDVQSQLALPLLVKDRLVGVLAVESPRPNAFDELDEVLLAIVANQAATAIDNARTYQLVERLGRLKRFFSPHLAELIVTGGADDPLRTHRRDITVVFVDLRGFTAFSETAEPEEVMAVLREYHAALGRLIFAYEGTLERFAGDGMMIFFNDPVPVPDAPQRAVRMAVAMRDRVHELTGRWRKRGYDLGLGVGIAQGYATIGAIGFEGRWDYGAIGTVTNLAARLCGEAQPGQILVSARVAANVEDFADVEETGRLTLKGFARPIPAFNVLAPKRAGR